MPQTQMDRIRFKIALLREFRSVNPENFSDHDAYLAHLGWIIVAILLEGGWN